MQAGRQSFHDGSAKLGSCRLRCKLGLRKELECAGQIQDQLTVNIQDRVTLAEALGGAQR